MATKRRSETRHDGSIVDPVVPDQGGRLMECDPGSLIPTTDEELRRRAYELYEERGRRDGKALDDWLAAEHELKGIGRAA